MTPPFRKYFSFRSSQQLPCLHFGPLKGFLTLERRPSRALNSTRALLQELKRNKDTVRFTESGTDVLRHRQQQLTKTLIVRLLKMHIFTQIFEFEKSTKHNCVCGLTWPEYVPPMIKLRWKRAKVADMTALWQWKMCSGVVFLKRVFHTRHTPSGSWAASVFCQVWSLTQF